MPSPDFDNHGNKRNVTHELITGKVVTIAVVTVEGMGVVVVAVYGGVPIAAGLAAMLIGADVYLAQRLDRRRRN